MAAIKTTDPAIQDFLDDAKESIETLDRDIIALESSADEYSSN